MKYTNREIKLYEVLTKISILCEEEKKMFFEYLMKTKKRKSLVELLEIKIKIQKTLRNLKIPKKFLILKELTEKEEKKNDKVE